MTTKTKIIIGIVITLLLLFSGYLIGHRQIKAKDHIISMLIIQNQQYESTITKNNAHITTQDQQITTMKLAQQALLVNIDSLKERGIKNVGVIVKLKTEITRLKLEATYTQQPIIIHDPVEPLKGDYLKLPAPWGYNDRWFDILGTIGVSGVSLQQVTTYSEPSITLGYSKKLFNSKPIVVFEDKNPFSVVKDMNNIVIINKPPFYKRPGFYILEGIAITLVGAWTINQLK